MVSNQIFPLTTGLDELNAFDLRMTPPPQLVDLVAEMCPGNGWEALKLQLVDCARVPVLTVWPIAQLHSVSA